MNLLPAYFSPSTIVLVDDDSALLSMLVAQLPPSFLYRCFTDPFEAVVWLGKQESALPVTREILPDEEEPNRMVVNLHLLKSVEGLYSAERFARVSVVVVDHSMPQMTGIDVATALQNKPVKKIMLTGESDKAIAIRAFNAGILHRYFNKDLRIYPALNAAIAELHHTYFREQTRDIMVIIAEHSPYVATAEFVSLIENLIEQLAIVEYYCVDVSGSFLLLDAAGKPYYLAVQSSADMARYGDIARGNEASASMIAALQKRQQLPVFFREVDHQRAVDDWCLQAATRLETSQGTCYYSLMDTLPQEFLDSQRVVPFNQARCSTVQESCCS